MSLAALSASLTITFTCVGLAGAQTGNPPRRPPPPSSGVENTATGSIRGRVVLPNGAFVSDAIKITLHTSRGTQTIAYTDQQGQFEIIGLTPGNYALEAEADREQQFEVGVERVQVNRGMPSIVTVHLKEKKPAAQSQAAGEVVSVGELTKEIPPAAVKEFNRASKAAKEEKIAEAITHLEKAISIYPAYLMAHNDLGTNLLQLGKLEEATAEFRRAIEIDPKAFNPQLNLGIVLVQQHNFPEAAEILEKALALNANSPAARLYAGLAFVGLQDFERAEKELQVAYRLGGSQFALALFHLGQLYLSRGEREQALKAFESYLHETPGAANARQVRQLIGMLRQSP